MAYSTTPGKHTVTLSMKTSGIASNDINISVNMNMTNIDLANNCKYMTGLRTTTNLSTARLIFDTSNYAANTMGYLFVRNPITTTKATTYVEVLEGASIVSRLYEGQFCFLPVEAGVTDDITLHSNSDTETFEYCLVAEDPSNDHLPAAGFGEDTAD
tara:strand:- start:493 stop:963 length:471 start_codon:yes stop_codon:yes gene_type:complete